MELGSNIKNLLYLNDCIIIPGLGGFVARYYPARVDGLRRKLKPPCKEFSFDDSLVQGGEIVVSFLARAQGIEEAAARTIVERFALETRAIVQQGDKAELPGLGWFSKGPKGKIHFEFDMVNNFHPETAGLPELNLPEFNKSEKMTTTEITEPAGAIKKGNKARQLFWILPLLLVLGGATFAYLKWDQLRQQPIVAKFIGKLGKGTAETDLQPRITMGVPDSASSIEQAIDTVSSLKNALTPGAGDAQQVVADKYANCTHFYLIAGSFRKIKNAQELSERLSAQGYQTEILTSKDGMYRVSLMVYTNRLQALEKLEVLKAEKKIDKLWLLSI